MEEEKKVACVMYELHQGHGSSLYTALIMMRTILIKSRSALNQLIEQGAIQLLIKLLEQRHRHVGQTKTTDIVMSILANLCAEEDIREKVLSSDGMSVIAEVTLSSEQESIQNRGIRALASMALDVVNCDKIYELGVPTFVAKRLMETEDVECKSTFCRALQLFGQSEKYVKKLMEDTQAIQALAALLKLDNRKLAVKSLRILSELIALRCCPSFTSQMLVANVLEELVTFADDEDNSPAYHSLSIILRLCEQEIMRPPLGSAGAISLMVKLIKSDRAHVNKVWTLNALCLCTKEAVNRIKIREAGGLELLMSALSESQTGHQSGGQFSVLYDRIISSIVNFLYNDDSFDELQRLGLVRILLYHLKRVCQFPSVNDNYRKEVDSLAVILKEAETMCGNTEEQFKEDRTSNFPTQKGASVCQTTASNSNSEFSCNLNHNNKEGESTETDNSNVFSITNDLPEYDKIGEGYQIDNTDRLNGNGEQQLIDCDMKTNNSETEKSELPDIEEQLFQQASTSRHTFSINSPTYQSETAWRLEDYTSGVTCKSFSQEYDLYRMSPQYPSASPSNIGMIQSPYSPLSAGASYYSPSPSSPSHNTMSPLQSTLPSSPASTLYQDSPTWILSPQDYHRSPGGYLSPVGMSPPGYHTPDNSPAPLTPSEQHSQSPIPSSQASLFSHDSSAPSERQIDNFDSVAGTSGHLDQMVTISRKTLPFSSTAIELTYSASEDEDDDNDEYRDGAGGQSISLPTVSDFVTYSHTKKDRNSTVETTHSEVSPTSNTLKHINTSTRNEAINLFTSNCKQTSHLLMRVKSDERICSVKRLASGGFIPEKSLSDDEEIVKISRHQMATNSSSDLNLTIEESEKKNFLINLKTDNFTEKGTQRPSSVGVGGDTENVGFKSFQRMSSFPGKGKLPAKHSGIKRNFSASISGSAWQGASPKYQALFLVSDSPYRSPYPDSSQNSVTSYKEDLTANETNIKANTRSNSIHRSNSRSTLLAVNNESAASTSGTAVTNGGTASNTNSTSNRGARCNQNVDEARINKILRATEANILVLLARISIKTKPIILTESMVSSYLLGYIASSANPFRRSCRILHRVYSNPFCFHQLLLSQVPVLLVKSLIFERDGSLPREVFSLNDNNKNFCEYLASSQSSDCGSQTSEFGRNIDFEFGGDAYSRMTAKKRTIVDPMRCSIADIASYTETARDSANKSDDIYETGVSRVNARVRIGFQLLGTLGAVAMSKFGEGEIKQLLLRSSPQAKLACILSIVHMRVGWCSKACREFFASNGVYEIILPCLFMSDAPLVREAIVAAIILSVNVDKPPKLTQRVTQFPVCPDLKEAKQKSKTVYRSNEPKEAQLNTTKHKTKLSPINSHAKSQIPGDWPITCGSSESGFDHRNNLQGDQTNTLHSLNGTNFGQKMDCCPGIATSCQYKNISLDHDVYFSILKDDVIVKISAHKQTLIDKSEVFGAMFCGSYSESTQAEIHIPDVDRYAFEFIIHYLHGCSSGCSIIDSLSLESLKLNEVATSVLKNKVDDQTGLQNQHGPHDSSQADVTVCEVIEDCNILQKNKGDAFTSSLEPRSQKSRDNISPKQELTHSEDSLDSLTLEDRPKCAKSNASKKLNFAVPGNLVNADMESQQDFGEQDQTCYNELIGRCENIMSLADRFLLHGLAPYPVSVLAYVGLGPHTIEDIFHIACYYKLDALAFDCIRETLMSDLSCAEAAAIYVSLANVGYREQVETALTWLLNYMSSD